MWWSNNEQRKNKKDDIKNIIKRTKINEKAIGLSGIESPPPLCHSLPTSATYSDVSRTRAVSVDSQDSQEFDFSQAPRHYSYDLSFQPMVFTPHYEVPLHYHSYPSTPYEVDIKTERQTYINDVPTRRDSTTSTFSTYQPPLGFAQLPPLAEESWVHEDSYEGDLLCPDDANLDFSYFDFSHGLQDGMPVQHVHVDDCDKGLLDHFIDKVLRLIFPIMEINQHGSARSSVILPALQTNQTYLHCCLSIAAIHLKSIGGNNDEQLNSDIMRHRYATIAELCQALNQDTDHFQILDACLGMIFFHCSVGGPDDSLPDIPWHNHFQAASDLVKKLELPQTLMQSLSVHPHPPPPFNMTLTSWIDILGATMLGRAPLFADTYRELHFSDSSSGLAELMGCQDRMMYMISEISCLESLKLGNALDDVQLCSHISALGTQMDMTEPAPGAIASPWSPHGHIIPQQLSNNMTALFRVAARIWLCSLVPNFTIHNSTLVELVDKFAVLVEFIPAGPNGFDRSLVWPFLISGAFSTPNSSFRAVFASRVALLDREAEFGSFGRMKRLLQEVWRQSDEAAQNDGEGQNVHWRDVMHQKGWDFLLI